MHERCRVEFDRLEWQSPLPGARFKAHRDHGRQLRMVEFTAEFVEPVWCEKGHVGVVLEGELEIDFHGERVRYRPGDGIFIPAGPDTGHKARSITPVVRLILVEDL